MPKILVNMLEEFFQGYVTWIDRRLLKSEQRGIIFINQGVIRKKRMPFANPYFKQLGAAEFHERA